MPSRLLPHSLMILTLLTLSLILLSFSGFSVQTVTAQYKDDQISIASYELSGTVNIATGAQFAETEIGGLSSITYDPAH